MDKFTSLSPTEVLSAISSFGLPVVLWLITSIRTELRDIRREMQEQYVRRDTCEVQHSRYSTTQGK